MRQTTPLVLVVGAALAACSTSTHPELEGDTFALSDIDGLPLPVTVSETWIADTLRFEGGHWTRVEVVILQGEGTEPDPVRRASDGVVRRDGARIVLDLECPLDALALCLPPDTLLVAGAHLLRRPNEGPLFRYTVVR